MKSPGTITGANSPHRTAPGTAWVAARTGPTPTPVFSRILTTLAGHLGDRPADLTLSRVARTEVPFHVLVACLISLRTKDEVTEVAAPRLLAVAASPRVLAAMAEEEIARLIYPAMFYRTKARSLKRIAGMLVEDHSGRVPDSMDALLALPGVGRKTANLVLTLGFGLPGICVDIHVHRICNRMGYVLTGGPDDTEQVLRARLPRRFWIPINDLLVTFGRETCRPVSPRCSQCPVRPRCPRIGVTSSR